MGRTEYYYDPRAPKTNGLIPASNLLVVDVAGAILLQGRRDTRPATVVDCPLGVVVMSHHTRASRGTDPRRWVRKRTKLIYTSDYDDCFNAGAAV